MPIYTWTTNKGVVTNGQGTLNVEEESDFTLQLTDITGRMVISENQSATEGFNTYEVGLNHLSKGVYMLEVKSGVEDWKTKMVVE